MGLLLLRPPSISLCKVPGNLHKVVGLGVKTILPNEPFLETCSSGYVFMLFVYPILRYLA